MSKYQITLEREVLREKTAGILADFNRYIKEKNISKDKNNPIILLKESIGEIYRNIFNPEYSDLMILEKTNGKLDLAIEILNKLN
ncbi:MAG: hypothetical protein KGV57_03575 [Fusobacterium sp.]|nr:hypothetical protein [Fusobacterium sp.]